MASDAAPIRMGHVDSTVQQLPPQAYPEFRSSKGATAVSSFCGLKRVLSALVSIVITVVLIAVIVVVLRRASNGKEVLTGRPASPSPRPLAPSGPGPTVCQPPPATRPGVTILDHLLSSSAVKDPAAESKAKTWNISTLPPPTASSNSTEHKDTILLRFAEPFDPILQATLKRLQTVISGRRLLASNVTDKDLFATVQSLNATNGFMAPSALATMLNNTHPVLAKLPGMLSQWYYSAFSRTIILRTRSQLGVVARALLDTMPKGQLEFLEHAKPIFKSQSTATLRPNDPNFAYQWALPKIGVVPASGSTTPSGQTPAWSITQGNSSIVVAVMDSGVDYTHPDLAASMWINQGEIPDNGIDDDKNGYTDDYYGFDFVNGDGDPMDDDGHGSHCAGIIAAQVSNREGIAGVAPSIKIMALKVLDGDGNGLSDLQLLAQDYVMAMGAHITSNSYGGNSSDPVLEDSLQRLADRGILFVAAAGNEHRDTDVIPSYPASSNHPNIISVAASDENDCFTNFTNYGDKSVHLAAPGQLIISTVPAALYSDKYLLMSGTSQAAPHVAAVAALVLSEMAALGETVTGQAERVKQVILQSVAPVPAFKGFLVTGGRLDAAKAVATVKAASGGRRRQLRESRRQLMRQ